MHSCTLEVYFESMVLYFDNILSYFESLLLYFERILLYFQSALLDVESIFVVLCKYTLCTLPQCLSNEKVLINLCTLQMQTCLLLDWGYHLRLCWCCFLLVSYFVGRMWVAWKMMRRVGSWRFFKTTPKMEPWSDRFQWFQVKVPENLLFWGADFPVNHVKLQVCSSIAIFS